MSRYLRIIMRWFLVILSAYIFVLAVIPCSDCSVTHSGHEEHSILERQTDHDDKEHSHDECTPFCTCSCCGSLSTFQEADVLSKVYPINLFKYKFTYKSFYKFDYTNLIWHPPIA